MSLIAMKVRHEVKAQATGRVLDFYITDDIKPDGERFNYDTYSWERVESTTSQRYFVEALAGTTEGDTVNLYINSMGGSVKEALGIYAALKRSPAYVVAHIDGFAASAASVIAVAADQVIMPRNTTMMIHNAAWCVYGNAADLRKAADDLDVINAAMLQSYVVKAGDKLPPEKLEAMTAAETWLSADDCILYGLADEYDEEDADLQAAAAMFVSARAALGTVKESGLPAAMAEAIAAANADPAPVPPPAPPAPVAKTPEPQEPQKTGLHNMLAALIKEMEE